MATYSPEQFGVLLDKFALGFPKAISDAVFVSAQQLDSDIGGRIFGGGETKDIEGGTRGYRSERWIREREDRGFPINRVDLIFNGDLKRSPKLFDVGKAVELRIVGQKQVDKARGNEDYFEEENGAKVFEASVLEEKNARLAFEDELTDYIQKFFD